MLSGWGGSIQGDDNLRLDFKSASVTHKKVKAFQEKKKPNSLFIRAFNSAC